MLHVVEQGRGTKAVVLLHGFGGSAATWSTVARWLAPPGAHPQAPTDHDLRLVMPDLPGFGESAALPRDARVADMAAAVGDWLQEHGVEHCLLVGHSMGGKVALALAVALSMAQTAQRPVALSALLLLAPSPPTPEPIDDAARRELLAGRDDRAAALRTLQRVTAKPLPPALAEQFVADQRRSSPAGWRWWLEAGSRETLDADLTRITAPVQVLSGTQDRAIPTDVVDREVVQRLAGARLQRLDGCGHLLPLEAPSAVAQAIVDLTGTMATTAAAANPPPARPALG